MLGVSIERKLESFNYSRGPKKKRSLSAQIKRKSGNPFLHLSDPALSFDSPTSTAFPSVFQIRLEEFCIGNLYRGFLIGFGALQRQVLSICFSFYFLFSLWHRTVYVGSQLTATERLHFNVFDFEHHFDDCELELHAEQKQ